MKLLKNRQGFTLIEVLIYSVIFSIVAGLATSILLILTRVNQKQSATAEVNDQLNFVMQKIQYLVKQSSNIEISTGITTSTLKLRMENSSQDPTCLSLVNGVIPTLLNFGSVNVQTAGTAIKFVFEQIPNPNKVKMIVIDHAREAAEKVDGIFVSQKTKGTVLKIIKMIHRHLGLIKKDGAS